MQRLLQGDVGSGKTIVALFAALLAMENGFQAAIMAPTELLAEQHQRSMGRLLEPLGIVPLLVTGGLRAKERRDVAARLADPEPALVVGTHALVQDATAFAHLGLAVVDEQHRFGVEQRKALGAKGEAPDVLLMTATPIPRSLALTLYGDLDLSVIDERPPGRLAITTALRPEAARERVLQFVDRELAKGRQAYVVYPVIEESEKTDLKAATTMYEILSQGAFGGRTTALLHGRIPGDERDAIMRRFRDGQIDVLVATTVIEVGIDVANATVMLIEGAERYGLSQLHQLRGRVGRGEHRSQCILFADAASELARRRLEAIASESDGFKLAEVDLALRGEGEILGTRQHGLPRFRVAQLPEDVAVLTEARGEVIALLERTGSFDAPELGPLLDAARARFGDEAIAP